MQINSLSLGSCDSLVEMDSVGALALDQFEKFASGNTLQIILDHFNALCDVIQVEPTNFTNFNKALRVSYLSICTAL